MKIFLEDVKWRKLTAGKEKESVVERRDKGSTDPRDDRHDGRRLTARQELQKTRDIELLNCLARTTFCVHSCSLSTNNS